MRSLFCLVFLFPCACADVFLPRARAELPPVADGGADVSVAVEADVPVGCATPWRPLAHLTGTLLRDGHGRYWVVDRWPDRREVLARFLPNFPYASDEAIPLSAEEERCLRASTALWYPRASWTLRRLSDGSFWYVDDANRYRREARPPVIAAWRDRLDAAELIALTVGGFERTHRDLGPMPPPDGALFLAGEDSYLFADGELHRFESRVLAREAGYEAVAHTVVPLADLRALAPLGTVLTRATFSVCPLAAAQLRETEDHDADGIPFFRDCDDDDARRAPGNRELCDGLDNDCDLVVDNGFRVGFRCVMGNACRTQAYTRCSDDRLGTVCGDDEAVCNE